MPLQVLAGCRDRLRTSWLSTHADRRSRVSARARTASLWPCGPPMIQARQPAPESPAYAHGGARRGRKGKQ